MRSSFVSQGAARNTSLVGLPLAKTPNRRHQVARRRWIVVGGVVALALASSAIGVLTAGRTDAGHFSGSVATGPFSYFPYQ